MSKRDNQVAVSDGRGESSFRRWNVAANVMLVAGAAASLGFTLYTGRNNKSFVLVAMFAAWVLLPFAGLYASDRASRNAHGQGRISLLVATVILSLCSAIIYGAVALEPPRHNTAFLFLVVPAVSWVIIGADALITRRMSRS